MELYIGGYAQGKLDYVMKKLHNRQFFVADGDNKDVLLELSKAKADTQVVFYHFHSWIRQLIEPKKDAEKETERLIHSYPGIWIISDEVGNGIVPMDPFEREYRERLGRILIRIASESCHVERIICGLGQTIK